jgi:hypothetical protein
MRDLLTAGTGTRLQIEMRAALVLVAAPANPDALRS